MQGALHAAAHHIFMNRDLLSYHICDTVSLAKDDMFDNEEDGEMRRSHATHKEEGLRRRRLDADDRAMKKSSRSTQPSSMLLLRPR